MRRPPLKKHLLGLLLLWTIFALVVWTFCVTQTPVDDAYITFRYVRHLVAGHGLVFNPGEAPLEGYSSLLWLLLLAPFERLGMDLAATAHVVGALLGMATLGIVALGERGERPRWLGAAALIACLPWLYHTVNGLETGLVACLIAALTCLSPNSPRHRKVLLLVAVLLPLARPEGLLAVLAWSAASQFAARRWQRDSLTHAASALTAFAAQLAFRLVYHHAWIANSARAKMMPPAVALPPGLLDLGRFLLTSSGMGVGLLLVLLAGARVAQTELGERSRARALFLLLFAPVLATSGGDSFPLWRFFVPLAPTLLAAADDGLQTLLAPRQWPARTTLLTRWLAGVVLVTLLLLPWRLLQPMVRMEGDWVKRWAAIGERLGQILPPTTTIALAPAGALPYLSRFQAIDLLGLNDAHIAHLPPDLSYFYPGHQRHDGDYVLKRQPDLIFLSNGPLVTNADQPFPWREVRVYEQDILRHPLFRAQYRLVAMPLRPGLLLQVFARAEFAAKHGWSATAF